MSVPFAEQGGRLRGVLDVVAGRFPWFVFGGPVGRLLPVFHFHDERAGDLEPKLRYLAENGYRTVLCDDIAAYVAGSRRLPERSVALCFDDAWASVWTTAAPLLQQHGLQAIVYAIPGRTVDAAGCRPQQPPAADTLNGSSGGSPFATWPELRALRDRGVADVQSHTFSHAMIATSASPVDFVRPGYEAIPYLNRPLVDVEEESAPGDGGAGSFVSPDDLGAPLYATRSRMSDAPRVRHSPSMRSACVRLVQREGGSRFFADPGWRDRLRSVAIRDDAPVTERADDQQQTIGDELDAARSLLNAQLRTSAVNHVCLPWGVAGRVAHSALKRQGFATAVANRLPGVHAVRVGDDPLWLKRLPNKYIYRLPGDGRRWWFVSPR
jgi:hypothetical protein